jgi:hypothetical protein
MIENLEKEIVSARKKSAADETDIDYKTLYDSPCQPDFLFDMRDAFSQKMSLVKQQYSIFMHKEYKCSVGHNRF